MNSSAALRWVVIGAAVACLSAAEGATESEMNVMRPASAGAAVGFVNVATWDFTKLLATPPGAGTPEAEADLAAVRQVQAWRTPEQVAWAKLVERDTVFNNASVIGAWFTKERLPQLAEFFAEIGADMRAMDRAAKLPFQRLRPPAVDASLRPCVTVPTSTSYPSGSAMQAWVFGELLAEIFPFRREELLERAERAAWGRVIGGVHFPSDLVGGKRLAAVYLAEAWKNPLFQIELEMARKELMRAAVENVR